MRSMHSIFRSPRRVDPVLAILLATLLSGSACAPAEAARDRPERRVLACFDLSRSITEEDVARWSRELDGLASGLGEGLYDPALADELVVLPCHAHTGSATPVARVLLPGGQQFKYEAIRRRARAEFAKDLEGLAAVELDPSTAAWTDLLSIVDAYEEYASSLRDREPERRFRVEVHLFSDLLHSTKDLDMEASPPPFDTETATDFAALVLDARGWPRGLMSDATVNVRLSGTPTEKRTGIYAPDRVAAVETFWRALFRELGADIGGWGRL